MQLRPRQKVFVDKAVTALDERGNTLGVAPTGAGKTVMLSAVAGEYVNKGASGLVLQHRDELVSQNRATFEKVNPRRTTGLFTADRKEWGYDCTFAMTQTLSMERNLAGMPPVDFIALDEGHHAVAPGNLRIFHAAKERNPNVLIFLVTATPERGDGKGLKPVVDNVCDQITVRELIEARLLVRPRTLVVDIGVQNQLRGIPKRLSDFDMSAVEEIMDKTVLNERVVEEWSKAQPEGCTTPAGQRQTVVFCSTVAHAQHVAETFRQMGYRAACIEGNMSDADRRGTLAAYDRGDIQIITNVAVLTEGWDHQPTSCVILLRPSSFKSTMMQMIGRGLRKVEPSRYPGVVKDDCIVLDFGTSILTHGSIEQDVDIEAGGTKECPECDAVVPYQMRDCAICGFAWPRDESGALAAPGVGGDTGPKTRDGLAEFVLTEVDLLADSPYRYENLFNGFVSMASGIEAWAAVISYHGHWHAIGGCKGSGVSHLADNGDRLLAMSAADDFLREHGDSKMANKAKRWLTEPATPKQLSLLGLNSFDGMGVTRYEATCRLQWKWSERAIRSILETASRRMAA